MNVIAAETTNARLHVLNKYFFIRSIIDVFWINAAAAGILHEAATFYIFLTIYQPLLQINHTCERVRVVG